MDKVRRRSAFAAPMAQRDAAQTRRPEARAALEGCGRGGSRGAMLRAPVGVGLPARDAWRYVSEVAVRFCPVLPGFARFFIGGAPGGVHPDGRLVPAATGAVGVRR